MRQGLFKDLLRLKLEMVDCLLEALPGALGEKVQELEKDFLTVLSEVLQENVAKKKNTAAEKQVTPVVIE